MKSESGGAVWAAGLLVLLLLAMLIVFAAPVTDCPVCTAKDPSGYQRTYYDLVSRRGIECCQGKGRVTLYGRWRLNRILEAALTP